MEQQIQRRLEEEQRREEGVLHVPIVRVAEVADRQHEEEHEVVRGQEGHEALDELRAAHRALVVLHRHLHAVEEDEDVGAPHHVLVGPAHLVLHLAADHDLEVVAHDPEAEQRAQPEDRVHVHVLGVVARRGAAGRGGRGDALADLGDGRVLHEEEVEAADAERLLEPLREGEQVE